MAIRHAWGDNEIVVLDGHETVQNQCSEGDAAVSFFNGEDDEEGWGVVFVGKNFELNGWDTPFASADEAVNAIRNCS